MKIFLISSIINRLITVTVLFLLPLFFIAQTTSFVSLGTEQGLVQSQVQSLTQDDQGNLWIGTIAGITKYNGTSFDNYTKKDGLAEDWITTSYKDKEGNIWFGHWAGNISRWNKKTNLFENLGLEEYTRFKAIRGIVQDEIGRFWIATEGAGIFIFNPKENKMFTLKKNDGVGSDNIYGLVFDGSKNLWFATDSGLTMYSLSKPVSNPKSFVHFTIANGFFSNNITTINFNSNKELWLGSADKGVGILNLAKGVDENNMQSFIAKNHFSFDTTSGLKSTFVKTIYEDHYKNMWVGTIGGGISLFIQKDSLSRKKDFEKSVFKSFSTRQGLNYFNVNAIYEDREYNLWIGTDIGLNQFRGERLQTYDENDELPNNIVWSVLNDKEHNLWLGTNNGLCKVQFNYTSSNKIEQRIVTNYTTANGLPSNTIYSLYEDSKGNVWVGTSLAGVAVLEKGASKFISYNKNSGLASDVVYSITEDKEGSIWFGTKEGACKFIQNTKQFRSFTTADGLGGNHVYRIFKDSKGLIWFGALGGSLSVFDGVSFKKYDESYGIINKFILSITEDKQGNIWFGCYGGGLYKFDGKKFYNFRSEEGTVSESPYSLICDAENNIWIGNNKGIERRDAKTGKFYHYGKKEGFLGVECNPNAVSIDSRGCIWFGTIMGAVKFNPSEDIQNIAKPVMIISGIKVHFNDTIFPADAEFAYFNNNITFKFVGVSLANPEKIKYQYRLEGFDKGWIPTNTNSEVVYTNLAAGKYIFQVKSCNNNEIWSDVKEYSFVVKPPFWQTALFYVLVTLFIIFGVFVYDKLRNKKLKRLKRKLEREVEKRTLELAIKNEQLAEKNKDVTDSINYSKRLQDATLPSQEALIKIFPEAFVFLKPKDIVTGDFWWVNTKEDTSYCAVVDCTGHGVPGAFLSIIANNLLNEAFAEESCNTPSKLLDKVNELASKALSYSGEYQMRDGMDISLIAINSKNGNLSYAGAHNSIYIISNGKLKELKADHISIGSFDQNKPTKYTNHEIQTNKNDQIYLFTDGYADQFGGPLQKKYKYGSFQQFLVSINSLNGEEQKLALDNELIRWKGNNEQIDDVCVLGIKV